MEAPFHSNGRRRLTQQWQVVAAHPACSQQKEEKETAKTAAPLPCNLLRLNMLSTCSWKTWQEASRWHSASAHVSVVALLKVERCYSGSGKRRAVLRHEVRSGKVSTDSILGSEHLFKYAFYGWKQKMEDWMKHIRGIKQKQSWLSWGISKTLVEQRRCFCKISSACSFSLPQLSLICY